LADWKEASLSECGIEPGAGMSLAKDEPVATRRAGILRIYTQDATVENSKNISTGKDGADVWAATEIGHAQGMDANPIGESFRIRAR